MTNTVSNNERVRENEENVSNNERVQDGESQDKLLEKVVSALGDINFV